MSKELEFRTALVDVIENYYLHNSTVEAATLIADDVRLVADATEKWTQELLRQHTIARNLSRNV